MCTAEGQTQESHLINLREIMENKTWPLAARLLYRGVPYVLSRLLVLPLDLLTRLEF